MLWLGLHIVDCIADLTGTDWLVPPEVDAAMGSVIALVLGGPAVVKAIRGSNGNGKGKPNGAAG